MSGEDVAVGDAALRQRIQQRAGHVLLSNDVGKTLRAVLAS